MFQVTGRLSGKKEMKTGVSSKGEWKILQFSITKRYNRSQIHLWYTATGKRAELISKLRMNEKVDIEFYPKHTIKNEYIFTENVVTDFNLSRKRPSWTDTNEIDEPEMEFRDDCNLQSVVDKYSKKHNGKRTKT